jgi:hypothetical protein
MAYIIDPAYDVSQQSFYKYLHQRSTEWRQIAKTAVQSITKFDKIVYRCRQPQPVCTYLDRKYF